MKQPVKARRAQANSSATDDVQLKFDGPLIKVLGGAPVDAVVDSLNALQRLVYLIGMKAEGQAFIQRVKPSAKVRREYAVVCHAPVRGSHVQPFRVASQTGSVTPASVLAGQQLLRTLKAFDSADVEQVEQAIPNARERWFFADAAAGLLPQAQSGIEITIRAGSHGPFSFKADRARAVIERFRAGTPPTPDDATVVGKLKAVDYTKAIVTIHPASGRLVKFEYPLPMEPLLQANPRRCVSVRGDVSMNSSGDIIGFNKLLSFRELESSLPRSQNS